MCPWTDTYRNEGLIKGSQSKLRKPGCRPKIRQMASASFHVYVVSMGIVNCRVMSSSSVDMVAFKLKVGMRVRAMGFGREEEEAEE